VTISSKTSTKREDDFEARRAHLRNLSDAELQERFWALAEQLVDPMVELARTHTTPSIERSVLMRMGFSSIEAKVIVEGVIDRGLMGKGAGHVLFKLARSKELGIRETGLALIEGRLWDDVPGLFGGNTGTASTST
jgi:D-ornithine 4,5-aminomutase subunit alpha